MLYQINNGSVSVGGTEILSHLDFEIKGQEKIAIVGRNGAGKTTLLRLIAGELELDRDDKRNGPGILSSRKVTIGYLTQNQAGDGEKTVEEILLEGCPSGDLFSRERFEYEMEYDRIFTGFGFQAEEKKRKLGSFSGGEQTKIALIRLLLLKPDILLLDEPTNHLDIQTVEWLEGYMKKYDRAVVFVSHDRFFLDQVVDVVYELNHGKLKRYAGNYTAYRLQKRKDLASAKKAYERQQEEIHRLNDLIEKFKHKPKKAAFARSRKKIIERMEKIDPPEEDDVHIFAGDIEPLIPGSKWVFEAEHLKIGYQKVLLELSLRVRKGQKIGIIGENGVGKSTFLKTVAGLIPPMKGKCILGNNTTIGYFDQQSAALESEKQVVEHFHELFPVMTEKEVRQALGAYLFSGKMASTKVSGLSGGEKSRLVLAELLNSKPNLLILDEPTNHMDVQAKETLESAFQSYKGTILFVSHDRYFIQQVADAILVFQDKKSSGPDAEYGSVMYYPFGYEHYLSHCRKEEGAELSAILRAEDQALVAGLKAVPKGEKRYVKEMSSDEAYLDWQLRLRGEQLEESRRQVEVLSEKYEELLEQMLWSEELESVEKALSEACDLWTEKCLDWMEMWQEFKSFRS
ncbi:MAG: ABC-F family ATP-binding cassette domain-containing protein [Clostridiales bacterium]|nr:ABC-F family ATP-binding cassette domain-containing protein [Candidatus Blautia equi]